MVAAMHIQNENDRTAFGLRTTELRNIAIGFAVAIALIMVAGQMADSGSASASDTELTDSSAKRFVNIGITVVAADNYVTSAEEQAGALSPRTQAAIVQQASSELAASVVASNSPRTSSAILRDLELP